MVANGTTTGALTVQEGSATITGPAFTISSQLPYNVSPESLSLLVGQSQTISVTDSSGNTLTGLRWLTSNPNIVSLSSSDLRMRRRVVAILLTINSRAARQALKQHAISERNLQLRKYIELRLRRSGWQ